MKHLALIIFLVFVANAFGQVQPKIAKSPAEFVPAGYVVTQKIQGDLNKDDQADSVLIIKGTDEANFVKDESGRKVDRNRRGIVIALRNQDHYELVLESRSCFSSENEDGGVYFPPELGVFVEKGNLRVHYSHGRYGFRTYKFRYQNSDFELIGFDSSEDQGPVVLRSVSINFVTKKMRTRENTNQYSEPGGERFRESWKDFVLAKPIRLREIAYFDYLVGESFIGSGK